MTGSPPLSLSELDAQLEATEHQFRVWSEITPEARDEVTARWTMALAGIPGPFVVAAFRDWRGERMPLPHQIAAAAREMQAKAAQRLAGLAARAGQAPAGPQPQPITVEQRIALLEANLAEHGPNAMVEGMLARARAELARKQEGAA